MLMMGEVSLVMYYPLYNAQLCDESNTGQSAQSAKTHQSPTEFVLKLPEKEKFCAAIYKF